MPSALAMVPGVALRREQEKRKKTSMKHGLPSACVLFLLLTSVPYKCAKRARRLVAFPYKKTPNYKGEGTRTVAPLLAGNDQGEAGACEGARSILM